MKLKDLANSEKLERPRNKIRSFSTSAKAETLQNDWQFWLDEDDGKKIKRRAMGVVKNMKVFWWFYDHYKPELLTPKATVQLFKNGIEPSYGHPKNRRGGHYKMTCKSRDHVQKLWLDVALVLIGEQFENLSQHICGAAYHVAKGSVSFWLANASDEEVKQELRRQLVTLLPVGATIAFRDHTSLLGKENVANVAGLISEEPEEDQDGAVQCPNKRTVTDPVVEKEGGPLEPDIVPHAHHRVSRSCPEDVFSEFLGLDQATVTEKGQQERSGRRRAFSEAAKRLNPTVTGVPPSEDTPEVTVPRMRGRSYSRVVAKRRTNTPPADDGLGMRKVLSADALDQYIPHQPIHTALPTLKNVGSWADDEDDSDLSSRCISPTGGDLTEGVERQPITFVSPLPPPAPPAPPAAVYDTTDYGQAGSDWDQSEPPSLAHSGPTSPAGVASTHVVQQGFSPSPTHSPYAMPVPQMHPQAPSFSLAQPYSAGGSPQTQSPVAPPQGHGMLVLPTGQHPQHIHGSQSPHAHPVPHGLAAHPEQVKQQLQLFQQQQQLEAQQAAHLPPPHAASQRSGSPSQNGLRGLHPVLTVPTVPPAPSQQAVPQLGGVSWQQQQKQQQQFFQPQQLQPLQAPVQGFYQAVVGGGHNSPLVQPQSPPAGSTTPQKRPSASPAVIPQHPQPPNPHGWEPSLILEYLTESSDLMAGEDEQPAEKYSKSRSPRNRRKIRERKIKEAAEAAKKEMDVWCPIFNAPENSWVSPIDNVFLPMPASFQAREWFRFVQACKKEEVPLAAVLELPADFLEKLGCESHEQRAELQRLRPMPGPQPHPFHALAGPARQRKQQQQQQQQQQLPQQLSPQLLPQQQHHHHHHQQQQQQQQLPPHLQLPLQQQQQQAKFLAPPTIF